MAETTDQPSSAAPVPRVLVPTLLAWFTTHARDLPWRRTRDPYAIWVSEIMLQQTQVKTVIPYWERWLRELPTIEALATAAPEKVHKLWEGLGYYTRVRNLQKAAQQIQAEHGGNFPTSFAAILALPGIGRYTAGAIASIAFNQPAPILDGNVIRVLARLHGIGEDPQAKATNARLWQLAGELVAHARDIRRPKRKAPLHAGCALRADNTCSFLNQSLMELGALICTPRSPDCAACPVAPHCTALREDRVAVLPRPKQRAPVTARRFVVFVLERNGKFLVQQRAAHVVNAHLWEFPNAELGAQCSPNAPRSGAPVPGDGLTALATEALQLGPPRTSSTRLHLAVQPKPFCIVKHSITRYRLTAEAHRVSFAARPPRLTGVWRTVSQLHSLPFTAAHRQIAAQLEKIPASDCCTH